MSSDGIEYKVFDDHGNCLGDLPGMKDAGVPASVLEKIFDVLKETGFSNIMEEMKFVSDLAYKRASAKTEAEIMAKVLYGPESHVEFIDPKAIMILARGSVKTQPPIIKVDGYNFAVFYPPEFREVNIDDLFKEMKPDECEWPVFFDEIRDEQDINVMQRRIKTLTKDIKHESHPLRKKQLQQELDGLRKEVKRYGKKK